MREGMSYVKLHVSILDSSVWLESSATRIVWLTLMAMADRDGLVKARAPGVTARARVTPAECDAAMACFRAPDPHSRTPDNDGRRIVDTREGIQLLNYEAHRDAMNAEDQARKHAERQARYRGRKARRDALPSTPERHVTPCDASDTLRSDQTQIRSDSDQIRSDAARDSDARARDVKQPQSKSGETWATVLHKLRSIHGSDVYDPSTHKESLEWIAARPAGEVTRALKHYAADPWAMANPGRAHPKHIRGGWDKYLDGPMRLVPKPDAVGSALSPEATAYRALCDARDAATGDERARLASEVRAMARAARRATGGRS